MSTEEENVEVDEFEFVDETEEEEEQQEEEQQEEEPDEVEERARELEAREREAERLRLEAEQDQDLPITEEVLGEYGSIISPSRLPNREISIGGVKVNPAKVAEEHPEVLAVATSIAGVMARQMFGREVEKVQRGQRIQEFWSDVREEIPDAKAISQSKEFVDWINKDDRRKKLAQSRDAKDAVAVLRGYKKSVEAKSKKKDVDQKTGLLAGSVSGGSSSAAVAAPRGRRKHEPTDNELDRLFDEIEI